MSSKFHMKLDPRKSQNHRNFHSHQLVVNPKGLHDIFYRGRAHKNLSDGESVSDSESLDSEAALEFVQGNKGPPIQDFRDQDSEDDDDEEDNDSEGDEESEEDNEDSDEEVSDEPESDDSDEGPQNEASSISFGALAKAQEALGKRKRSIVDDDGTESPEISKRSKATGEFIDFEALERKAGKKDTRDFSRTSKHAPTELSSKKAVSRKRLVVPTKKIDHRDPRFEPLSGALDEQKLKKNYSFLDTYRDSEMVELKAAIRKAKDLETKEKLKRTLLSMESRKKAQERKNQEQEVLRKHRREEKEKIEMGKKPFYLKRADQKKLALVGRFEGMKGKQVDKVIERRRKKQSAKERKSMPDERRG